MNTCYIPSPAELPKDDSEGKTEALLENDPPDNPLLVLVGLPFGFLGHCLPLGMLLIPMTRSTRHDGVAMPVLLAVTYCIGSTMFATALWKSGNARGVAFGLYAGVALTALLTGQCVLSGQP